MEILRSFAFRSVSGPVTAPDGTLGLLSFLPGTWIGTGFNQIWRPVNGQGTQDHFLELNETKEILDFTAIPGNIPNRGLFTQPDINLAGMTYLQQIQDANVLGPDGNLAGLHIEPGIWINVPPTTNPQNPTTRSHDWRISLTGHRSWRKAPPSKCPSPSLSR